MLRELASVKKLFSERRPALLLEQLELAMAFGLAHWEDSKLHQEPLELLVHWGQMRTKVGGEYFGFFDLQ
jgi:hypothetical protein